MLCISRQTDLPGGDAQLAAAATLQRTGDGKVISARVQTLLPWHRETTASDEAVSNTGGDDYDDKPSGGWLRNLPLTTLICVAILIMGLGVRIFDPPMVEILRVKTFDLYQRLSPRASLLQHRATVMQRHGAGHGSAR